MRQAAHLSLRCWGSTLEPLQQLRIVGLRLAQGLGIPHCRRLGLVHQAQHALQAGTRAVCLHPGHLHSYLLSDRAGSARAQSTFHSLMRHTSRRGKPSASWSREMKAILELGPFSRTDCLGTESAMNTFSLRSGTSSAEKATCAACVLETLVCQDAAACYCSVQGACTSMICSASSCRSSRPL